MLTEPSQKQKVTQSNNMKSLLGLFGAISFFYLTAANRYVPPEPQPTVCPCNYNFDPVCGSDGVTYTNECVLDCTSEANMLQHLPAIEEADACECTECTCQDVDLPVCTLDGETYPNECELACENLERIANHQSIIYLAYATECRGDPGHCTSVAYPVCGSDNVVYRNRCVLESVNNYNLEQGLPPIEVQNTGDCEDSFMCPVTRELVCGSDGNIYNNLCELEAQNQGQECSGETPITEADPSVCADCCCPDDSEPVCGSDGTTYDNLCQLNCESFQNNPDLTPAYEGECDECDECVCNDNYSPVCGTDQNTYDNYCLLECENIGVPEEDQIEVFHVGECQQFACDCSYCDGEKYDPICGSDDQTYYNRCYLQCNNRCCLQNGGGSVTFYKSGAC